MNNNALLLSRWEQKKIASVHVFGVNHMSVPEVLRKKLAYSAESIGAHIQYWQTSMPQAEVVLLSTCNRTEWYFYTADAEQFWVLLSAQSGIDEAQLRAHLIHWQNRDAVQHIYRVACGLDSLILGEPQILGQLKTAYQRAKTKQSIGFALERLFQQSFSVAKQVRHSTMINENPVSVAYAGVKLTHQFFDDYPKRSALVIGAGETGQLVARYLRDLQMEKIIVANRTVLRAQALAEKVGGYAIALSQIADHLHEADIIVGCAYAPHPIITQAQVKQALKSRRGNLQVYIDLSMPRVLSDDLDTLNNIFLYTLEDLSQLIENNKENRRKEAQKAEKIVHLYSDDYIGWLYSKPQHQLVRQFREHANRIRQELLDEAYRRLAHGEDAATILAELSYKLTNKLIHHPSAMINAIPPNHRDWLAIVADTFDTERMH